VRAEKIIGGLISSVYAERTVYGLIVLPIPQYASSYLHRLGYWMVVDPITGYEVCRGESPGRLAAIGALIQLAVEKSKCAGGFRAALYQAQKSMLRGLISKLRARSKSRVAGAKS
jgi:hypothetical protein